MNGQLYIANHRDTQKELRVTPLGGGRYRIEVDGQTHDVDARRFGGGNWSLLIDGQSYDVELEVTGKNESEGRYNALVRGRVVQLGVKDERHVRMAMSSKRSSLEGPQMLVSPMPGKVVKILTPPGTEVTDGEPVLIVEAMKMENEIKAPKSGKVTAVLVKEGQAVEAHEKLMIIE